MLKQSYLLAYSCLSSLLFNHFEQKQEWKQTEMILWRNSCYQWWYCNKEMFWIVCGYSECKQKLPFMKLLFRRWKSVFPSINLRWKVVKSATRRRKWVRYNLSLKVSFEFCFYAHEGYNLFSLRAVKTVCRHLCVYWH